ncbi:MAG: SCO6880 family protein [Actinomycetota bacterium]
MTEQPQGHVFPKWGPRGPFRVYSWTQASVTVFGLLSGALMLVAGMGGPALVLVGVLGAMTLRDPTGMPVWTRVGLGLRYLVSGWLGHRRWSAADDEVPSWLSGVEVSGHELAHGMVGVVRDRGRYLAAMRVSPTRDPWLQNRSDREAAADEWARVLTSLPVETVDRLQVLTVSREGGGDTLLDDAAQADGPSLEVVKEAAAFLAAHVRHTETVLVVRLSLAATSDAVKRGGEAAVGRLLYSTLQHLGAQLPPERLNAEILAPGDWHHLFHMVLAVDTSGRAGMPSPSAVKETWNAVTVDGTIHRLLWMWQWPQRPMATGFLAPLLTAHGNLAVSLVVAPADPERHQRSLDWAYRRAQAAVDTAKSSRHRKEAELDSLDRQLRELNEGHVPVRVLATVAVSADTDDQVDDLAGTVRSHGVAGSCRIATHGGRQMRALPWVLPLCRGLDKGVDG